MPSCEHGKGLCLFNPDYGRFLKHKSNFIFQNDYTLHQFILAKFRGGVQKQDRSLFMGLANITFARDSTTMYFADFPNLNLAWGVVPLNNVLPIYPLI